MSEAETSSGEVGVPASRLKATTLYLLDDSQSELNDMRTALGGHPEVEVVGSSRSAEEGIEQVVSLRPDVVVVDKILPNERMDGIGVIEHIARRCSVQGDRMPKCILYSNAAPPMTRSAGVAWVTRLDPHSDQWLEPCVLAGAAGYMQKGPIGDLVRLIREVHAGRGHFVGIDPAEIERIRTSRRRYVFTPAEKEVLRLRCSGMSTGEIAIRRETVVGTVNHQLKHAADRNYFPDPALLVSQLIAEEYFRRAGSLPDDPAGMDAPGHGC